MVSDATSHFKNVHFRTKERVKVIKDKVVTLSWKVVARERCEL